MPVATSYPGVYIQEVPSGVRTITGVATSIAAFFGRTLKGPLNEALRCLSHADFLRNFGGSPSGSELALSVKQFFDNGGTDCYVVRLASGAQAAGVTLLNTDNVQVLVARAKYEGQWGDGLRLEVDYNTPNPGETFNLRVILEEGGTETSELFTALSMDNSSSRFAPTLVSQSSALIDLAAGAGLGDLANNVSVYNDLAQSFAGFSQARRPLGTNLAGIRTLLDGLINTGSAITARHNFDISVNSSAYVTVNLSTWTTAVLNGFASLNALRSDLETRINTALNALVPAPQVTVATDAVATIGGQRFLTITSANGAQSNVRVRRSSANDISAALLLGAESGGVEMARRSNFRPVQTGVALRIEDPGGANGNLDHLNTITGLTQDQITGITVDGGPLINLAAAPNNLQTTGAGDSFFRDALTGTSASANNDGVREKLRIIAQAISNTAGLRYRAEVQGYELVIIAKDGTVNQTPTVAFAGPSAGAADPMLRFNTRRYTFGPGSTSTFATSQVSGLDGNPPGFADFVGDPVTQTGFHALDVEDIFNLLMIPRDEGVSAADRFAVWGPASIYCQSRRAFLLIEAPDDWTANGRAQVVQDTSLIGALRATVVKDHSAVFYPKVRVNEAGIVRTIGSSGAIAGLMARIDASRGVWKAPAGTEADLRGLTGIEIKLTDLENGVLNKLGVNCARLFVSGYVNWGARTMDGADDLGSEWKYIPIRRLALFLEESLFRGTQWVVFEPNDEPLWANIRLNIGAFMNGLFRQGAFQGTTPDKAFYVKCDAETTTQADRNLGIVNIEVGFAPLKPAEFVIIKIQQIAGDLT